MRYIMKQLFTISDNFSITDENERDIFYVRGKFLSIGDKLSLQDLQGNELNFIKQRVMSIKPNYEIYRGERLQATLKKELFTFFKCKFHIEMADSGYMYVEGDFTDHEYVFIKNGRTIAHVSKKWLSLRDKYGIEIENGEDNAFILSCIVAIDMICHNDSK